MRADTSSIPATRTTRASEGVGEGGRGWGEVYAGPSPLPPSPPRPASNTRRRMFLAFLAPGQTTVVPRFPAARPHTKVSNIKHSTAFPAKHRRTYLRPHVPARRYYCQLNYFLSSCGEPGAARCNNGQRQGGQERERLNRGLE